MNPDPTRAPAPLAVFDPIAMIRILNTHHVRYASSVGSPPASRVRSGPRPISTSATRGRVATWSASPPHSAISRHGPSDSRSASPFASIVDRSSRATSGPWIRASAASTCSARQRPGIDFDYLSRSARRIESDEAYLVASFDDLITMKREAGRAKDRAHIDLLEAVREEVAREAAEQEGGTG